MGATIIVIIREEMWELLWSESWQYSYPKQRKGALRVLCGGKDAKQLIYPDDLTKDEIFIVNAAWEERYNKDKAYKENYLRERAENERRVEEGCVWVRNYVWNVERDHIWRSSSEGMKNLKFSELTNDEMLQLVSAKEREVLNRGLGGLFRRINRKLQGPDDNGRKDMTNV